MKSTHVTPRDSQKLEFWRNSNFFNFPRIAKTYEKVELTETFQMTLLTSPKARVLPTYKCAYGSICTIFFTILANMQENLSNRDLAHHRPLVSIFSRRSARSARSAGAGVVLGQTLLAGLTYASANHLLTPLNSPL